MELIPCFCCVSVLVGIGAFLAYAPFFVRRLGKKAGATRSSDAPAARPLEEK